LRFNVTRQPVSFSLFNSGAALGFSEDLAPVAVGMGKDQKWGYVGFVPGDVYNE
jgi:hypothetical protein